jgi:hypothetical protein
MGQITYAKVGGPPAYWQGLKVINLDTGQEVLDVVEVDAHEGWLISYRRNAEGHIYPDPENPEQAARQRVEGRFEIRRPS